MAIGRQPPFPLLAGHPLHFCSLTLFASVMLIRFDDVYKSYGANEVLKGVTFQVNPGERVGLVGRNGAGKTTLFRLAERAEEPDRGQVFLPRGIRLGVVSQQPVFPEGSSARGLLDEALSVFAEMHHM